MTIPGRDWLGHPVSLVVSEDDRLAILEIDQQLALENQEELVSVIVLVPVELAWSRKRPTCPLQRCCTALARTVRTSSSTSQDCP
jgi:hypothetical protein